ncbi:MAG TPA: hypothetical protein VHM30_20230 [Gemmatimonadaceae bacterium]|nr:hypothetical protein [Gemmatimonadaceae bacterium]
MRIEYLPIAIGVLVGLLGVGLVADAWLPDRDASLHRERRRRTRAERSRGGEAAVGAAIVLLGVALIVRDEWGSVPWIVGIALALLALGGFLNRRYFRQELDFRAAARRDPTTERKPGMPEKTPPRERLRLR